MIRALIVDDAPAFRGTLRAVLECEPEIEIVGEAGDGDEAIALDGVLPRVCREVISLYHKEQAVVAQLAAANRALKKF